MTEAIKERISLLKDVGRCRAKASGHAYYVCWAGGWNSGMLLVTSDPQMSHQIVAVCRPEAA